MVSYFRVPISGISGCSALIKLVDVLIIIITVDSAYWAGPKLRPNLRTNWDKFKPLSIVENLIEKSKC